MATNILGVDKTLCCYHMDSFELLGRYKEHQGYVNHMALIGVLCAAHGAAPSARAVRIRAWVHKELAMSRRASTPINIRQQFVD